MGPTRAAIETRDKMGGSMGTCHVTFCSLLFLFLLLALFVSIIYSTHNNRQGLGEHNGTNVSGAATRDGTWVAGGREGEVEGRAAGLRRGTDGEGERGRAGD